ncbi:MAG TPA: histidine kinase [Candidatus Limnocylindrales bacterium]|nr:histidine kinase [Candidatus Limnocylindrales bacterium]
MAANDPSGIADRIGSELAILDSELAEIDLLIQQARSEADRHEMKRSQTAERVATLRSATTPNSADVAEATSQLVQLTRRAVMMESQVDVLQGKQKALGRYHEALERYGALLQDVAAGGGWSKPSGPPAGASTAGGDDGEVPAAVSRLVLTAQEDLRRDIARAMHDGPAQSLTNIVLQAQIVDRLVDRDPTLARAEVKALIAMVQTTLEATKAFIFDVRPMVLDDLGLVPTIRRTARERGRRSQIVVDFDSLGTERRLDMELESGLFRMIDQALAGYLSTSPRRVTIRLDWGDQIEARIAAHGEAPAARSEPAAPEPDASTPAVLAQMIDDRRTAAAIGEAESAPSHVLPTKAWREILQRAATLGMVAELLAGGTECRIVAPATTDDAPPTEEG